MRIRATSHGVLSRPRTLAISSHLLAVMNLCSWEKETHTRGETRALSLGNHYAPRSIACHCYSDRSSPPITSLKGASDLKRTDTDSRNDRLTNVVAASEISRRHWRHLHQRGDRSVLFKISLPTDDTSSEFDIQKRRLQSRYKLQEILLILFLLLCFLFILRKRTCPNRWSVTWKIS